MEYLFLALHFQSVCVPCFEVGLLYTTYKGVLFLLPFSQSLSFGLERIYSRSFLQFNPFTFKVIINRYDPIAIYFIVLGSGLYTLSVFPVLESIL